MVDGVLPLAGMRPAGVGVLELPKSNKEGAQTAVWPPLAGKRPAGQGPRSRLDAVRGGSDGVQAVLEEISCHVASYQQHTIPHHHSTMSTEDLARGTWDRLSKEGECVRMMNLP